MSQTTKEIKNRIKSIQSTKKMTKAMEMVAASKMKKAISKVLTTRPFSIEAWKIFTTLVDSLSEDRIIQQSNKVEEVKNILAVLFSPDRGFCGSFNSQLLKKFSEEINDKNRLKTVRYKGQWLKSHIPDDQIKVDFIVIGKKGEKMIHKMNGNIIETYQSFNNIPKFTTIRPIAQLILEKFNDRTYQKVILIYTDFISIVSRKAKMRQLLPISRFSIKKSIAEITNIKAKKLENEVSFEKKDYLIEPDVETVFKLLMPRLIEMQIYHALLESKAAEESARMIAMNNATDAAKKIAAQLTLKYNQLRQMKITQEISEISAGKSALES